MKPWFLSFFLLAGATQAQTTWYVDVHATPPGLGTQSNPYASIQYAHNQTTTAEFDTILVAPGEYHENLTFTKRLFVRATGGAEVTKLMPAGLGPILRLYAPPGEIDTLEVADFTITGLIGPADETAVLSFAGTLVRCIVRGNRNGLFGVDTQLDSHLVDCTVVDNDVGIECSFANEGLRLENSIVWGNDMNVRCWSQPHYMFISYSAGGPFPSFAQGPGNIVGDPGFWSISDGDYHLRPGSVCIDAGNPALLDPDGSRSDIGYYTFDPLYAPIASYCTGKLNSDGCVPVIAGSGLPSATSPSPFLITASLLLPSRSTLLLYAFTQGSAPFQGATLCVAAGVRRVGGQTSGGSGVCGGTAVYDFNQRVQSGVDPSLITGALVNAQWFARDPLDPAGLGGSLSDALRFGIAP